MIAASRVVVVRGRVQGVGFRDAAVQAAFAIGVDGLGAQPPATARVEAFVQGDAGRGRARSSRGAAADRRSRACRTSSVDARSAVDSALRDFALARRRA